ncbi:MAG: hypothetical protein GY953_13005 [bacterium]|nr:hypothetical protein [bacterium]
MKTLAEDTPDHYVLELSGLPPRMLAGEPERLTEELHSTTSLNRKNKAPVSAGTIEMTETEQAIIFKFPKHAPIELGDKEVEFHSRLGPAIFQRKFKLKPMIYGDRLAL